MKIVSLSIQQSTAKTMLLSTLRLAAKNYVTVDLARERKIASLPNQQSTATVGSFLAFIFLLGVYIPCLGDLFGCLSLVKRGEPWLSVFASFTRMWLFMVCFTFSNLLSGRTYNSLHNIFSLLIESFEVCPCKLVLRLGDSKEVGGTLSSWKTYIEMCHQFGTEITKAGD